MSAKIDAILKKVQKDHGPGSVKVASDTRAASIGRISTGIFFLDYATGGGIPVGRTVEVYGKKSSGKSSLMAKIVASAQKQCRKCYGKVIFEEKEVTYTEKVIKDGLVVEVEKKKKKPVPVNCVNKCLIEEAWTPDEKKEDKKGKPEKRWPGPLTVVWIDAEGTFDVLFYEKFGVDCDRVYLIVSDYGEQAIDIADAMIQSGDVDIIVVDSVAHLVPKKEREESTEDSQVALQARLVNKAMRIWTGSLNQLEARGHKTDCTIILANQTRQKPAYPYPIEVLPAGWGQEFAASLEIRLKQKEFQFAKDGRTIWQDTEFSIEKNKVGPPKMSGFYRMCVLAHTGRLPGDTWDDEAVADTALKEGLAVEKDKGLVCQGRTFKTEEEFRAELATKGELFDTCRKKLLDLMVGRPSDGELAPKKEKK